ncbi:MAG: hypothetical protein H7338_08965, partial [Candidatus Sericytochromatia bacterium]|nr:hypothetical protein [Candidatus Sericytochromatia bacterium]
PPEDLPRLAALHDRRALELTGMVRRTPGAWAQLGGRLTPHGPLMAHAYEQDGTICGYLLFTSHELPGQVRRLRVLEWLETTPAALAGLVGFLHDQQLKVVEIELPICPDRPLSAQVAARGRWAAVYDVGPSLQVLQAAPVLAALWPRFPAALAMVVIGGAAAGEVVHLGPAGETAGPPLPVPAEVLAGWAGGAASVAGAVAVGQLQASADQLALLSAHWQGRPAYRVRGL